MAENNLETGDQNKPQLASADALIHQVRADGGTQQGVFSQGASENTRRLLGNVQMTDGRANAVSDTQKPTGDNGAQQQNSRVVDGANGSKIQLEKFPDGQEHPTAVREPDGSMHRYRWQEVGGKVICTAIEDVNASGKVEAQSMLNQDQKNWSIRLSSGQQFNVPGQLDVKQDGTHEFTESQSGNKFVRKSTGEAHYYAANGAELPHPLTHAAKGTPSEAPQQRSQETPQRPQEVNQSGTERKPETPPDRVAENENGSRIEYRKAGGKEVVSAVVHPSGSRTEYGNFDSAGNAGKIEEYDPSGKKILSSVKNGAYWTMDGDGVRNGNEVITEGTLKVSPDGTHEFKEASGNTFTRKADGSVSYKNKDGRDLAAPTGPEPISESRKRARETSTNNETLDAVDWNEDSKGEDRADAAKYDSATDGVYDPARPWGLAKHKPGQAGGDDGNLDWRKSKSYTDSNGNTTYKYEGELEDSYAFNIGGDTNFKASETYNKDGKLVGSKVEYDSAVDQSFTGPNGQKVSVEDVKSVETTTAADGTLTTTIKDSSGKGYVVTRNGSGAVTNYRKF